MAAHGCPFHYLTADLPPPSMNFIIMLTEYLFSNFFKVLTEIMMQMTSTKPCLMKMSLLKIVLMMNGSWMMRVSLITLVELRFAQPTGPRILLTKSKKFIIAKWIKSHQTLIFVTRFLCRNLFHSSKMISYLYRMMDFFSSILINFLFKFIKEWFTLIHILGKNQHSLRLARL